MGNFFDDNNQNGAGAPENNNDSNNTGAQGNNASNGTNYQSSGNTDYQSNQPPPPASGDENRQNAPNANNQPNFYEPQYSNQPPYNNIGQQNQNNANSYNNTSPYGFETNQPYPPKKGKSFGAVFLSLLLVAAIILSVVAIGLSVSGKNPIGKTDGTDTEELTTLEGAADGPSLNFNTTPVNEPTTSATGELNPTDVYKKIYESSVGILVYSQTSQSLYTEGSGVIMGEDKSGEYTYIITCAHVISESRITVAVQLFNDKKYDAQIVGIDTRTDIAVVRIKASGLKAAEFADSSDSQVGQTVYAIGNPGGTEFAGSFTTGMISAIDRPVKSGYTIECIQHHAAINPGNSGGALVNAYGQVIGINSMKIADDYEGMGFAVPSKVFQTVVDLLIKYGYVPDRPMLGISYTAASQVYSIVVRLKELPAGSIVIQEINTNSALSGTDVRVGDMIVAVNGNDMENSDYLAKYIEESKVGDKLKLSIVRISSDYSVSEFDVTVELIEDKGVRINPEEETTEQDVLPSDFLFPFDY